jgi:replicative DNA helicase
VVLAGRPGMGKSALAITMARFTAQAGYNLLLNSLEMDSYSVADRAMSDIAWQDRDPCAQKIRTVDEPVGRSASASLPGA